MAPWGGQQAISPRNAGPIDEVKRGPHSRWTGVFGWNREGRWRRQRWDMSLFTRNRWFKTAVVVNDMRADRLLRFSAPSGALSSNFVAFWMAITVAASRERAETFILRASGNPARVANCSSGTSSTAVIRAMVVNCTPAWDSRI
jgi:hypothetical protein